MGRKAYTSELLVERGIFPKDWEERLYEVAKKGKGKMYYATELGLHRDTLYSLIDRDPKFKKEISKVKYKLMDLYGSKPVQRFRMG